VTPRASIDPAEATAARIFAGATDDPYTLALRAYVWGFALVLAAKVRQNLTRGSAL
jgi:hypothetical protein